MTDTGIGARVLRKEDKRFITGKGQYTDDINLKDQTYAYFVRSPHAHATIKSINTAKAKKMPGVVDVFTSKEVEEDKIGGLICGWMIHSKDGSRHEGGPASDSGQRQGALCGRPGGRCHRRNPRTGQGRRRRRLSCPTACCRTMWMPPRP